MASSARNIELPLDLAVSTTGDVLTAPPPSVRRKPARAPRVLRVERPRLGDDRVWEREVRDLPAHLLAAMPRSTTLRLEIPGLDRGVAIVTSPERAAVERESGGVVFDAMEWSALVTAAESDRLWPADLRELCTRKAKAPHWVVETEVALAGARAVAPAGWTIGRVLDRIGARLVAAEC